MNTIEHKEQAEPRPQLPENHAPRPQVQAAGQEWEKREHWDRLLTGDPATVPADLRRRAGADDPTQPEEERDYHLVSAINRSWVVDHRGLPQEKVRSEWPELRRSLSRELGVQDDEHEVFAALSERQQQAPRRRQAAGEYRLHFEAGLRGGPPPAEPGSSAPGGMAAEARALGERTREQYLPLAEALAAGWTALHALESDPFPLAEVVQGGPGLWQAVQELAGMDADERARVYAVAQSLAPVQALDTGTTGVLPAMQRSVRRGVADLRHGVVQGAGHFAAALTHAAAETLGSDTLSAASAAVDKRLQVLDELRRVGQGEVFPLRPDPEAGFAGELAVELAGGVPGAALAFMGGAGFGALALSGAGAAVAEARMKSPEGRQELQTAAGILGGALQAGIYAGMSRVGARMLEQSIRAFARARGGGAVAYSLAALQSLRSFTAENARLLLAGKAARLAELGSMQAAAWVDGVASHIDWEEYGSGFTDIETNMREAARNLPFVLIAAGRAGLHHFRSAEAVLGDGSQLAEWGVSESARNRIMEAPDIHTQNKLLHEALSTSRRWSAPGSLADWVRALKLLNTGYHRVFSEPAEVAEFLNLPPGTAALVRPPFKPLDAASPEQVLDVATRMTGRRRQPLNLPQSVPYMQLWDEWYQRSGGALREQADDATRRSRYYKELLKDKSLSVPEELRIGSAAAPHRDHLVRLLMADRMGELQDLSYRMLMSQESLDSLRYSYKSADEARRSTEKRRQGMLAHLLAAMVRAAGAEEPVDAAFAPFHAELEKMYLNRRNFAGHAPRWLKQTEPEKLRNMYPRACRDALRTFKRRSPQLQEVYRIVLGLRNCAESLLELLPHTAEFQARVSNGASPETAVAQLLQHEFRGQYDTALWNPAPDGQPAAVVPYQAEQVQMYRELSGREPESSPDGRGGRLWRMMRPDGRYTFWYADPVQAANEVAAQARLLLLPQRWNRQPDFAELFRETGEGGGGLRLRSRLVPRPGDRMTGFEQLGADAMRDFSSLWQGTAVNYGIGLELTPDFRNWLRHPGQWREHLFRESAAGTQQFAVWRPRVHTPLQMAQLRFRVYWHRLLDSGWVSEPEARAALEQCGMPPQDVAGGSGGGVSLARQLADLNLVFMLSELPESGLPASVRRWFSMLPFCADSGVPAAAGGAEQLLNPETHAATRWLVPAVAGLRSRRRAGFAPALEPLLRAAYNPDPGTRSEQGWCHAVGGEAAFRGAGQAHWNLLRDPARAHRLLPDSDRAALEAAIRPFCGSQEPAAALQELSDLLSGHPELHEFGFARRGQPELSRLVLTPAAEAEPVDFARLESSHLLRPLTLHRGYRLEAAEELPPGLREDARVLPALHLLSELRRVVADTPYADDKGIWWRGERYGGRKGRRPGNLDDRWQPVQLLRNLLEFYYRTAESGAGPGGRVEVCGVSLGGIGPGDMRPGSLRNITAYASPHQPDQLVRLMPGSPDAANPRQSAPYVVHSSDGVPLFRNSMARDLSQLPRAMSNLREYRQGAARWYSYEVTARVREQQMEHLMAELLEKRTLSPQSWAAGNESGLSNQELIMQIFHDSRLPQNLNGRDPLKLTRGEALCAELARLCLLAEYGSNPAARTAELVEFAARLRSNPADIKLLRLTLRRVVSPFPGEYTPEELNPEQPEQDARLD